MSLLATYRRETEAAFRAAPDDAWGKRLDAMRDYVIAESDEIASALDSETPPSLELWGEWREQMADWIERKNQ